MMNTAEIRNLKQNSEFLTQKLEIRKEYKKTGKNNS